MSDIKNLENSEAVEKLQEIADGTICLFGTYEGGRIVTRPMSTNEVDDDGAIWFISAKDSLKNAQLEKNPNVLLMYVKESKNEYLSLSGRASIVDDLAQIKERWTPLAKAWFPGGTDDPNISLIRVDPEEGHYWDTNNGKIVSMLKIVAAAITGSEPNAGVEGDIRM